MPSVKKAHLKALGAHNKTLSWLREGCPVTVRGREGIFKIVLPVGDVLRNTGGVMVRRDDGREVCVLLVRDNDVIIPSGLCQ